MLLDEPSNTLGIWFNMLFYGRDKTAANLFLTHMFFVSSVTGFWQALIGELRVVQGLFLTWTNWQLQGCINIYMCGWWSNGSGLTVISRVHELGSLPLQFQRSVCSVLGNYTPRFWHRGLYCLLFILIFVFAFCLFVSVFIYSQTHIPRLE